MAKISRGRETATMRQVDATFLLATCLTAIVAVEPAGAQCSTQWLPGTGLPGTDAFVRAATLWDPDGAGPRPPVFAVVGDFNFCGTVPAGRVATYDPATGVWTGIETGMQVSFTAVAALPNGDLVVAGEFQTAGSAPGMRVARWNGTTWTPLGSGINNFVNALAILPNGDIVAAGSFTTAGGIVANRIARWDGTAWSPLGSGLSSSVEALVVLPNGDLVAGGRFTTAGGVSASRIARWDGAAWSPLGGGFSSPPPFPFSANVRALSVLPNGDLVAGGDFTIAGGAAINRIARWDGSSWSPLGAGTNGSVIELALLPNGDLVAGGAFTGAGTVPANRVARWDGSTWSAMGAGFNEEVHALAAMPTGDVFAGGGFKPRAPRLQSSVPIGTATAGCPRERA